MRKLATAGISFAAAIFSARYIFPYDWLPVIFTATAAASLIGLFFHGMRRLRVFIIFISLAFGFIWSFTYTAIFIKPAWYLHDETATVSAIVIDYPSARSRGYRVDAEIIHEGQPSVGARFYYYTEVELQPGDIFTATARFKRTDGVLDGDRFDPLSSGGAFLSAFVSGEIEKTGEDAGLRYLPLKLAGAIANKVDEIFPSDVSPFLQALLVGTRDKLNRDSALNAALSASGIMHVVSISGMHVVFLMGFLGTIIRNKRLFAFAGIPTLLLFMAMTGFTPSVVRAGVMQMFLICAPMFKRESDGITSLSAALLLLLALNPYACSSVGLQLSFAATLGIILFTGRINSGITDIFHGKQFYRNKPVKTAITVIVSSFATTVGALIFTLPLTVIHFGYVSLITPLTNLLTLWAISLAFPIGLAAVILASVYAPLGAITGFPVTHAVRYIIFIAKEMAAIPYSVVYTSNSPLIIWLGYIYVMFIVLPVMRARARQYFYPACIAGILLCAVILISPLFPTAGGSSVTVLDVGQGLSVVVSDKRYTAVIDCGSNSEPNPGAITHEFLLNQGKTTIDLLILSHFHDDHINGVEFLLSRVAVSALAIPDPEGSFQAEDIIELARKRGTDIIYVTETQTVSLGETSIVLFPPMSFGDENERGLSVITIGGVNTMITGDMSQTGERSLLRFATLPSIDLLIVGHHGSRHSTSEELLTAVTPKLAVIPVGRNSYGHPSDDTLARLEAFNIPVYRTDITGNVTVNGK